EILRQNGYVTGCFGKWHNGAHFPYDPAGQGFDEFYGFCAGHLNNYFDSPLQHNNKEIESTGYITDFLTDKAIEFIKKHQRHPFFCYVPFNLPHSPFQVPDAYFDKFKAIGLDDESACVYGMCENLDDHIGRILDCLDECALTENTLVIFISDNGPNTARYNGGMRGIKSSPHEGGTRVPCFLRLPGTLAAGKVITPIAAHIDILPTLIDLLHLQHSSLLPWDGISLVPLLFDDPAPWPKRKIFGHWPPYGTVRTDRHRLIIAPDHLELYDMIQDPTETSDIAVQETHVCRELLEAYDEWWESVTANEFDPLPIPIGIKHHPEVILPAHEAFLHPDPGIGIRYWGAAGWANDWITDWTSTDSYPQWLVQVVQDGEYQMAIDYGCNAENIGVQLTIEVSGQRLHCNINAPFDPPQKPSPDRVLRKEAYEKLWQRIELGSLRLNRGVTDLRLRAVAIPGPAAIDLKAVVIRKK
ncbi:MAG: hypothetical protein EHM72_11990, partial [Calditrichaeota bacterium]